MNYKNIYSKFSIVGYYTNVLVVDVYDGDTITILLNPFPDSVRSRTYYFKVRLLGIDSEEIKQPKNEPNREELKKLATESRDYLSSIILNNFVNVDIESTDNFGRLLAHVYIRKNNIVGSHEYDEINYEYDDKHDDIYININKLMIDGGYAKKY